MIFQYDSAIDMPTMNVYDDGLMQQYINAVKEDYQKSLADQKEFVTKYGDFYSPIQKSVDWWNENVNDPIRNFVNEASSNGIDMRSPEFRAALSRLQNNMPYGEMQRQKQQAKIAEQYIQNRDALIRAGKFDPEFEKYLLNGKTLESWDPMTDGQWTRTSPEQLNELSAFAALSTNGLKDSFIKRENGYDHYGITRQRVKDAIGKNMLDYLNSNSGKYYLNLIAKSNGLDLSKPSQAETAKQLLLDQAIDRSGKVSDNIKVNEYDLLKAKNDYDVAIEKMKEANYYKNALLKAQNGGSNGQSGIYAAPKGMIATFVPTGIDVAYTPAYQGSMTSNTYKGPDGKISTSTTTKPSYSEMYNLNKPKNADIFRRGSKGDMHLLSIHNKAGHAVRFYPRKGAILAGRNGYYYQQGLLTFVDSSGRDVKSQDNVWIRLTKQYVPNKTSKK